MLETLIKNRTSIDDLILEPAKKLERRFDPSTFFTLRELKGISDNYNSTRTIGSWFNEFNGLVIDMNILFPGEKVYEGDDPLWNTRKAHHTEYVEDGFLRTKIDRLRWEFALQNLVAMRLMFPEKAGEFKPDDRGFDIAADQMIDCFYHPEDYYSTSRIFVLSSMLFSERQSEFRRQFIPETNEDYWQFIFNKAAITGSKQIDELSDFNLIDLCLNLKLLYPERQQELPINTIKWSRFERAIRRNQFGVEVVRQLADAKLLLADEIVFTEEGVEANPPKVPFIFEDEPIPTRRRF